MMNQSCISLSSKLRTIGVVLAFCLCAWIVQAQDLPPEVAHYADLGFAQEYEIPILIVLFNNQGYLTMKEE